MVGRVGCTTTPGRQPLRVIGVGDWDDDGDDASRGPEYGPERRARAEKGGDVEPLEPDRDAIAHLWCVGVGAVEVVNGDKGVARAAELVDGGVEYFAVSQSHEVDVVLEIGGARVERLGRARQRADHERRARVPDAESAPIRRDGLARDTADNDGELARVVAQRVDVESEGVVEDADVVKRGAGSALFGWALLDRGRGLEAVVGERVQREAQAGEDLDRT